MLTLCTQILAGPRVTTCDSLFMFSSEMYNMCLCAVSAKLKLVHRSRSFKRGSYCPAECLPDMSWTLALAFCRLLVSTQGVILSILAK